MRGFIPLVAAVLPVAVVGQQSAWGQCGGIGWTGATTCVSGYYCSTLNPYYFQCIPGTTTLSSTASTTSSSVIATTTSTLPTTLSTSKTPTITTTTGPSTTISGGGSTTGVGPGTTLQSGYYWIRAVESPNFHKYLQTNPEYTTGIAIMDNYTTAGQFNIVDGQLVEFIDPTASTLLYANVEQQANSSVTKLAMTFNTTPNTYGTFAFSGDAVTWTVSSITRPNTAAWLVCENQQLFINLGSYAYNTPAGCADETIHYYNGATAVDK